MDKKGTMPPINRKTVLLISARAGLWRDSLESYLKANPALEVHTVGKGLGEMYDFLDRASSEILLLEADQCEEELVSTLVRLKNDYSELSFMVIADTPAQYQAASCTGVGQVVMKSMLHNQLDEAFFSRKREEGKTMF